MACFIVPMAEAIAVTAFKKYTERGIAEESENMNIAKSPYIRKIGLLEKLLWGGSALLAFEHLWHGEIIPWFPFLTAAENSVDAVQMLYEMSTVGVAMAALVTMVWAGMVSVINLLEKKPSDSVKPYSAGGMKR